MQKSRRQAGSKNPQKIDAGSTWRKVLDVRDFFDRESTNLDVRVESDPILSYEQKTRHEAVMELLGASPDDKILDVGCGNLRDILRLAKQGIECFGVDLSKGMIHDGIKKIKKDGLRNVNLMVGSVTNLPFREGAFDKAVCSEVIEHVPKWEEAVQEIARCLKDGGKLVMTTPNRRSLYGLYRKYEELKEGFLRLFGIDGNARARIHHHPYDEWKTQTEVIKILTERGITIHKKVGICFLPSHLTYQLSYSRKRLCTKLIWYVEKKIRYRLHDKGYMIGISGIKQGASGRS